MPGIVGLQTRMPPGWAVPQLKRMIEVLQHESFYVSGMWNDDPSGIYVGWVERKNSFSEGMPLRNGRGDRTLIFSGEDFPDPGMTQGLKDGAPSYLAHLSETDPNFPACLNGRFHGLVIE